MSLVWGLTRSTAATNEVAAAPWRTAGFESAMTCQWYTTRRRGRIPRRSQGPRARSRLPLRPRPRGDPTFLPRPPRARRDRHGQGRAHRLLLRRRPSPRRLVRAGARGRPRSTAQGRAGPVPHRLRRRELARGARRRAPVGGGSRAHTVRRDAELVLRARPRRPRDRALRRSRARVARLRRGDPYAPHRDDARGERQDHDAERGHIAAPDVVHRPAQPRAERLCGADGQREPAVDRAEGRTREDVGRACGVDDPPRALRHTVEEDVQREPPRSERHEDAVLDGERHGRDREGASRVALGRPGVRHPARSTRRCASAASIDCRRWGGSIGFVTWSKAPNARLRLASSMFTLSFSMITFAAGTSATIAGSTPTPLSPGISTSSSTRWGALSTTARTPLAASLMRRTS